MSDKLIPQDVWDSMDPTERAIILLADHMAKEAEALVEKPMKGSKPSMEPIMRIIAYNMRKSAATIMVDGKNADHELWIRSLFIMIWGARLVGSRGIEPADMTDILSKINNSGIVGGLARGEQASAEAEKKWRALAREKAIKIKHDNPKFNQKQVIKVIYETWPAGIEPPPEDSLRKNVVRKIFQEKVGKKIPRQKKSH